MGLNILPSLKPKKLRPGSHIALVAPSSWCAPEDSGDARRELEKRGYTVTIHDQCLARDHMSAGLPEEKINALHAVFADPSIDAVFCLRGGYQALNVIDRLDYDMIARNPKILLGYSDITALHGAMYRRTGLVSFHGPNGSSFGDLSNPEEQQKNDNTLLALDFLNGNIPDDLFHDHPVTVLREGRASGRIVVGNMQLLSALIEAGDSYVPSFDDAILMIEDIGEEITKLERQFSAWRIRGIFKNLAGLVIGHMTDIKDTPGRAGSFVYDMRAVVLRHAAELHGPIILQAPFGHDLPNYIFPQGVNAELSAENGTARLKLLESPFSDA